MLPFYVLTTFPHPFLFDGKKKKKMRLSSCFAVPGAECLGRWPKWPWGQRLAASIKIWARSSIAWATWCLWVHTLRLWPWHHTQSPGLWPFRWNTSLALRIPSNVLYWNLITRFNPSTMQSLVFWLGKCSLELWGFEGKGPGRYWERSTGRVTPPGRKRAMVLPFAIFS